MPLPQTRLVSLLLWSHLTCDASLSVRCEVSLHPLTNIYAGLTYLPDLQGEEYFSPNLSVLA